MSWWIWTNILKMEKVNTILIDFSILRDEYYWVRRKRNLWRCSHKCKYQIVMKRSDRFSWKIQLCFIMCRLRNWRSNLVKDHNLIHRSQYIFLLTNQYILYFIWKFHWTIILSNKDFLGKFIIYLSFLKSQFVLTYF